MRNTNVDVIETESFNPRNRINITGIRVRHLNRATIRRGCECIIRVVASEVCDVVASTTINRIVTSAAINRIITGITIDDFAARPANDIVVAIRAQNRDRHRSDDSDVVSRRIPREHQTVCIQRHSNVPIVKAQGLNTRNGGSTGHRIVSEVECG